MLSFFLSDPEILYLFLSSCRILDLRLVDGLEESARRILGVCAPGQGLVRSSVNIMYSIFLWSVSIQFG